MRAIPRTLTAAGLAAMLYGTSGSAITLDEFVERHDLDGDGLLAVEEMTAGPLLDRNGDGFVDRDELAAVARRPRSFHWVNPLPAGETCPGVRHATFESHSMGIPVGYCIYLPPGYDDAEQAGRRYPVVYDLHGGSPGDERTAVRGGLAKVVHEAIAGGEVAPAIYVFVNGGAENMYNYPQKDSLGVDVFVHELIPHIDATYRTVAHRRGRALQGFSQGGRGTTRIMFQSRSCSDPPRPAAPATPWSGRSPRAAASNGTIGFRDCPSGFSRRTRTPTTGRAPMPRDQTGRRCRYSSGSATATSTTPPTSSTWASCTRSGYRSNG